MLNNIEKKQKDGWRYDKSLHMTTIVRLTNHRQVVAGELQPFTFLWGAQKHPSPPSPTPYGRLSWYVVFVVGTIEDCIQGVQNADGVFKKRQRPPFIAYWEGGGDRKMDCPILVSSPQPPPQPLCILLRRRC